MNKTPRQSNSKKREDRTVQARFTFDTLTLESKNVGTAMLLMEDSDSSVVAQGLASLNKYAAKAPENAIHLISLNILQQLTLLIENPELYVRRFAIKLLAELCLQEDTKKFIMDDPTKILYLCDVLVKEIDVPLQEFASEILAELTKLSAVHEEIINNDVVDILFTRVKSTDPDVQHNSAKIMLNLLSDPEAISVFLNSPSFDFIPILNMLQSEYPAIQNVALDVLDMLTKQRENDDVLEAFQQSKGLEVLIDILEKFDWKDLHPTILKILQNVSDNPNIAQYMNTTNFTTHLLQYMDDIHDPTLVEMTLDTISKMATTDIGRKMLMEHNITEILLRYIKDDNAAVTRAVCIGIGNMVKNPEALEILLKDNPMREIMSIIRNEIFPWETRHGAILALCGLLERDKHFCDLFLELHQQDTLFHMLKQPPGKVPVEMLVRILHCLAVCAASEETRTKIMEVDVTGPILLHLESSDAQLQIAACFALSSYVCETQVCENFISDDGPTKLLGCLKSGFMPVRQAAASLLQLLAVDPKVAEACINVGILDWMKEQKKTQIACPTWETAINTLFRSCLSAKFFYLNHLDMQDVTGDRFYVMKKQSKRFIVLDELLSIRASPIAIIYVANFGRGYLTADKGRHKPKLLDGKASSAKMSFISKVKDENDYDNENLIFSDQYLPEYLEQVKKLMRSMDENSSQCTIPQKAAALASFVASKMCGVSKSRLCTYHTCNLHITELKMELGSTIIPLGFIKVGMHLERAMLFKILADQIGLPCALIRGEYGRSWIEIAIPQIEHNEEKYSLHIDDLPTRLLEPNRIVDLMEEPGKLYEIGSFEAARYCGLPSSLM